MNEELLVVAIRDLLLLIANKVFMIIKMLKCSYGCSCSIVYINSSIFNLVVGFKFLSYIVIISLKIEAKLTISILFGFFE